MRLRPYSLAVVTFLLIPVVTVVGGGLVAAIDPEWALRTASYERNFHLLALAKHLGMMAGALAIVALWLLACAFLLKAKHRSYWWLAFAPFGPLGFTVLSALGDQAPAPDDFYQRFVGRLGILLRAAYELALFVAVWVLAYQAMVLKRDLMILRQAAATGRSVEDIIAEQAASSGMWAFSEGLEVMFLVVLFYLLWPLLFNAAARAWRGRQTSAT